MSNINVLLDRLDKVRQVGEGRWRACCPAHNSSNPTSLSVVETGNGVILIKCWAGCGAADIVAAIGLSMSDLFPEKLSHHIPGKRDRQHWHAAKEALIALDQAAMLIWVAAENVSRGVVLTNEDHKTLAAAAAHVKNIRVMVAGWKR